MNEDQLLTRVVRNSLWLFNASVIVRLFNLVRGIVLARLLVPDDFGVFGLALVVIGFAEMFSDVGASVSLIYKQKSTDEKYTDTAFWVNVGVATLLTSFVASISPLISNLYKRPELVPVLIVLSLSLWLQINSNIFRNILRRDLKFYPIAISEVVVSILSFTLAMYLALNNYGVWALVLSVLFGNVINLFLLCFFSKWLPTFCFSKSSLKELIPFSGYYLASAIVSYLVLNTDKILIGKLLDISSLGLYVVAYNFAMVSITIFATPLGNVLFPELARLHGDMPQFWKSFFHTSRLLVGSVCPLAWVLIISANDFFPLVFGAKWNEAILPFQIIAFYVMVRCLWSDPFLALGRFDLSLYLGLITLIFNFFGILIGIKYGIVGVAIAILIVMGGSHLTSIYVVSKSFNRVVEGFKNALPYFLAAFCGALIALGLRHFVLMHISENKILLTLISGSTIFVVYFIFFKDQVIKIFKTVLIKAKEKEAS